MKPLLLCLALAAFAKEPLAERIAHSDPAKYRKLRSVHAGAGELHFAGMFDAQTFNTNFIFLHRGVIPPGGGIGHHYHNHMEEMFVILDGEAAPTGGLGLCRELKNEIYNCPPVLVLTGRPQDGWLAAWSLADAVVPHPLDPIQVAEAVASLARGARSA